MKKPSISGVVIVISSVLLASCGSTSTSSTSTSSAVHNGVRVVNIGVIAPTTGPLAAGGAQIVAGSNAAAKVWNKAHPGLQTKLSICNDSGTAPGAIECITRLQSSVNAFAGPDFATDYPGSVPAITSSSLLDVNLSQEATPTPNSKIFLGQPSVASATDAMLSSLVSLHISRIAVLTDQEPGGLAAIAAAKVYAAKRGLHITSASFPGNATTAVPEVQALLSGNPQAVMVWTLGFAGVTALKALANSSSSLPVVMNYFNASQQIFTLSGSSTPAHVGVLGGTNFIQKNVQGTKLGTEISGFDSNYTADIHQPMSWAGDVAGGVIQIIMTAAKGAGNNQSAAMARFLESGTAINTFALNMGFSSTNHIESTPAKDLIVMHFDSKANGWVPGIS